MTDAANDVEAVYPYKVTVTAKGGDSSSYSSSISIAKVCVSSRVQTMADYSWAKLDIPEDGIVEMTYPVASTEYASGPPVVAGYSCS